MADRSRRAEARAHKRQEAVDALAAVEDPMDGEDSDDDEEMEESPVRVPQRRVRGPAVAPSVGVRSKDVGKNG